MLACITARSSDDAGMGQEAHIRVSWRSCVMADGRVPLKRFWDSTLQRQPSPHAPHSGGSGARAARAHSSCSHVILSKTGGNGPANAFLLSLLHARAERCHVRSARLSDARAHIDVSAVSRDRLSGSDPFSSCSLRSLHSDCGADRR